MKLCKPLGVLRAAWEGVVVLAVGVVGGWAWERRAILSSEAVLRPPTEWSESLEGKKETHQIRDLS